MGTPQNSVIVLAKLDMARSIAIVLQLLMGEEGLDHLHIQACVDQVMVVFPEEEIWIGKFLFCEFSNTNFVVVGVLQGKEGVDLLDTAPVVSFCCEVHSSLLSIPDSCTVLSLDFDIGSEDGCGIIGFSFVWPDAATSSSSSHV